MRSEIQNRADFTRIRYGQCWEDADVLVAALRPGGRRCASIGSAGDNSFALLAAGAAHVTAIEMNPAQVACIELRRAAYLALDHTGMLELLGARASVRRAELYRQCRHLIAPPQRDFWDQRPDIVRRGAIHSGKFEGYFWVFRTWVLPLAHSRARVDALFDPRDPGSRLEFYDRHWNNRQWRLLFRLFFSRATMGALGRDPEFFRYVEGSVAARILERTRHALVNLDPASNPYLHWILRGSFGDDLPMALRAEHFETIRAALAEGRFSIFEGTLETWLGSDAARGVGAFNLSDIFEYMSAANTGALLGRIADASEVGARLAYWNMLVPRSRPESLAGRLRTLEEASRDGLFNDRAFFYSRFVVEEVIG